MSTIFLDRDGVINENRSDYVKSWHEFQFLPGACEAIANLTAAGHRIVVCTNQAGIAKGIISLQTIEDIHQRMLAGIASAGGRIERVYYCPHSQQEGCACRKPRPGLLLRAVRELDLDLHDAVFIGDSMSDIQAGFACGVRPILVLTGRGIEQLCTLSGAASEPFLVASDLYHASQPLTQGAYASPAYALTGKA